MARTACALALSDPERQLLERWADRHPLYRTRQRASIILLAAEGVPNRHIATAVGLNQNQVGMWRNRYAALGVHGLLDRPRSGRPRTAHIECSSDQHSRTIAPAEGAEWDS